MIRKNRVNQLVRRTGCALLCGLLLTATCGVSADTQEPSGAAAAAQAGTAAAPAAELPTYTAYASAYTGKAAAGTGTIDIRADAFIGGTAAVKSFQGKDGVVELNEKSEALTYRFIVETDGLYTLGADYFPLTDKSALDTNLAFALDGKTPFEEARTVYLTKIYENETAIKQDSSGNDLRPAQVESPAWIHTEFLDNSGYNADPFQVYLTAGEHTLTVRMTRNAIALAALRVQGAAELPTYAQVREDYKAKGYPVITDYRQEIEAESADKKSGSDIAPENHRASAATEPSDPSYLKLNVISSKDPGDWISWSVTVPKSGLYQLGFRVLQDANRGMTSTRRLYIDKKVPFREAGAVEFPYSTRWYNFVAGGEEEPWLFYLEEGRHTITLECTTGRFASTLRVIQDAVYDLNAICRSITMVTGITPDAYRDYDFDSEIPDLRQQMTAVRNVLRAEVNRLNDEMDYTGSELVTVEDIIRQLDTFLRDPRAIASRLGNFRTNISTLGTWLLTMKSQSLLMDTIVLFSGDREMRRANAGFWQQLSYDLRAVAGSFLIDYNAIGGSESSGHITVWVSTGRDQATIIRRMIDDDFTSKQNVAVNLNLVGDSATLLQATLAGKGPDVALFVEKTLPVNLAARGALTDLSTFEGLDTIVDRFSPSAMIPYTFDGGVYALPNSQSFNVMFIRTDIFEELGLAIPETWDDFYRILPVIQRNNMQAGVGGDTQPMFETLIMQNGGTFYNKELTATAFDTTEVLKAFQMWTGFYTEYSISLTYDAFTYFRSGIMPLLIGDYTLYNQFAVAAPEINGLWTIVPIPGIRGADGAVNRREGATGTASILMASAKEQQAAYRFLDWWTSTDAQKTYSLQLESTMGPAARYNSANQQAVGYLAWNEQEYGAITEQWKSVWDFATIPSSYYVTRNIANAFRAVVYNSANERETLGKYGAIIDKEIARKNKELGLNGRGERHDGQ